MPDSASRAWYGAPVTDFLADSDDLIVGRLAGRSEFDIQFDQQGAWRAEIGILRRALEGLTGHLYLEFAIPRMGSRVDAVLLLPRIVLAIEFKVGATQFDRAARDQVWDYALDLKNFHEASHGASLVPVLVATAAEAPEPRLNRAADDVYHPVYTNAAGLRGVIELAAREPGWPMAVAEVWAGAPYRPTPTIIEAARALYSQHSVEAIARSDAGAKNLAVTSRRIEEIVDEARAERQKVICFVTGVPGAGKTLVGLNIATRRGEKGDPTHAVFLSGNGPLVAVLREALTRDEVARELARGVKVRKGEVGERVKQFIQNVHNFRDEGIRFRDRPPDEHVVIFDEAQRAWTQQQTANFMKRRKGLAGFGQSEPEFLVSYMDRHRDWAVVVCLVGGGQEINTGEAGIEAWLDAIEDGFPDWRMRVSSRLTDAEYSAEKVRQVVRRKPGVRAFDDDLHLAVSMRSFRAENVSAFVKALLDRDLSAARDHFAQLADKYPIAVTRDLDAAKDWVRSHARGTEQYGLVASSKASRLKPHAVDIRAVVDPVKWFLNGPEDTRSSWYLEDAATEFQVQGLELDWMCVTWDADLRDTGSGWGYQEFDGVRWKNVLKDERRRYLLNAYRVLLTRARQGMVIFVPPGDRKDLTRRPEVYERGFRYLAEAGAPVLS